MPDLIVDALTVPLGQLHVNQHHVIIAGLEPSRRLVFIMGQADSLLVFAQVVPKIITQVHIIVDDQS